MSEHADDEQQRERDAAVLVGDPDRDDGDRRHDERVFSASTTGLLERDPVPRRSP